MGKEETKLSLFKDNMISYIENPKEFTHKLIELISAFSHVIEQKINIQNLITFLFTKSKHAETEIKSLIPFIIIPKKTKYLGTQLRKHVQDLYAENYKILIK